MPLGQVSAPHCPPVKAQVPWKYMSKNDRTRPAVKPANRMDGRLFRTVCAVSRLAPLTPASVDPAALASTSKSGRRPPYSVTADMSTAAEPNSTRLCATIIPPLFSCYKIFIKIKLNLYLFVRLSTRFTTPLGAGSADFLVVLHKRHAEKKHPRPPASPFGRRCRDIRPRRSRYTRSRRAVYVPLRVVWKSVVPRQSGPLSPSLPSAFT